MSLEQKERELIKSGEFFSVNLKRPGTELLEYVQKEQNKVSDKFYDQMELLDNQSDKINKFIKVINSKRKKKKPLLFFILSLILITGLILFMTLVLDKDTAILMLFSEQTSLTYYNILDKLLGILAAPAAITLCFYFLERDNSYIEKLKDTNGKDLLSESDVLFEARMKGGQLLNKNNDMLSDIMKIGAIVMDTDKELVENEIYGENLHFYKKNNEDYGDRNEILRSLFLKEYRELENSGFIEKYKNFFQKESDN